MGSGVLGVFRGTLGASRRLFGFFFGVLFLKGRLTSHSSISTALRMNACLAAELQ